MTNQIKNFIEEGEKFFKDIDNYIDYHGEADKEDIEQFILTDKLVQEFSSRQISLIKMIVEMVESEKKERKFSKEADKLKAIYFLALDTISSKLKELYK